MGSETTFRVANGITSCTVLHRDGEEHEAVPIGDVVIFRQDWTRRGIGDRGTTGLIQSTASANSNATVPVFRSGSGTTEALPATSCHAQSSAVLEVPLYAGEGSLCCLPPSPPPLYPSPVSTPPRRRQVRRPDGERRLTLFLDMSRLSRTSSSPRLSGTGPTS